MPNVTLPLRRIYKGFDGFARATQQSYYVVQEWDDELGRFKAVSKSYHHSTSAFAALGRLTQKDTVEAAEIVVARNRDSIKALA